MNDHDLTDRLTALAGTMPDNASRLSSVRRRTRRLHQRQLAGRSAAATATLALGIVGASAAVRNSQGDSSAPSSQPGAPLPKCAVLGPSTDRRTTISDDSIVKGSGVVTAFPTPDSLVVTTTEEKSATTKTLTLEIAATTTFDDAGRSVSTRPALALGDTVFFYAEDVDGRWVLGVLGINAVDGPANTDQIAPAKSADGALKVEGPIVSDPATGRGKGTGVITAFPAPDSIEITAKGGKTGPAEPATLVIVATTIFDDAGQSLAARPALKVGDTVSFGGTLVDGHWVLDVLGVNEPDDRAVAQGDDGKGTVQSATATSVIVVIGGDKPAGQTITLVRSGATAYRDGSGPCADPDLAAGTPVHFRSTPQPDGTRLLTELVIADGGASPKPSAP